MSKPKKTPSNQLQKAQAEISYIKRALAKIKENNDERLKMLELYWKQQKTSS